jgi:predicted amidophosphoribosyltransferase
MVNVARRLVDAHPDVGAILFECTNMPPYTDAVTRATGLPVIRNVKRLRRTPYQSGLAARERRRNLAGAFAVAGTVAARHVVLVDDVMTTGETCSQLARVLLAGGALKVSVLALARA